MGLRHRLARPNLYPRSDVNDSVNRLHFTNVCLELRDRRGTKQMYMSKLNTFLLLRRTIGVSAADLRGAVSPKPGAADYVPPCKETYVTKLWN
jgi:hypothetical protein